MEKRQRSELVLTLTHLAILIAMAAAVGVLADVYGWLFWR